MVNEAFEDEACEEAEESPVMGKLRRKLGLNKPGAMESMPSVYEANSLWSYFDKIDEHQDEPMEKRLIRFKEWLAKNQREQLAKAKEKAEIEKAAKEVWKEVKEETINVLGRECGRYEDEPIDIDVKKNVSWWSEEKLKELEAQIEAAEKEQHGILKSCMTERDTFPTGQHSWYVTQYRRLEEYKLVLADLVIKHRYHLQNNYDGRLHDSGEPLSSITRARDNAYLRELVKEI